MEREDWDDEELQSMGGDGVREEWLDEFEEDEIEERYDPYDCDRDERQYDAPYAGSDDGFESEDRFSRYDF